MNTLVLDFGSSYIRAAFKNSSGESQIITDSDHHEFSALIPSAVYVPFGQTPVVGWETDAASSLSIDSVIRQPKKFLLQKPSKLPSRLAPVFSCGEQNGLLQLQSKSASWKLSDLIASLLREAKQHAEKCSALKFSKTVLTLPQILESRKPFFEEALRTAGFESSRFVDEAEAVLKAYGILPGKEGYFGVLHFGGGLFEISLFRISGGGAELLAREQEDGLGGEDLTWKLADLCMEEISEQWNFDFRKNPEWIGRVFMECEKAKCAVAHRGSYDIRFQDPDKGKYTKAISRYELMNAAQDIFNSVQNLTVRALQNSGLEAEKFHEIFLSGGSTRIPFIRDLVEKVFKRKPKFEINVDQAAVLGAAL